jgi:membrane protein implicated in regulation of membrane protease activity
MMEHEGFWLILGALLILSEFFLTGIVAVFFGIGAILVGILTAIGLIDSLPEQITVFTVLSIAALLFARERIRVWFRGKVSERWDGDKDLLYSRGERATVSRDFVDGIGKVRLSGTDWTAESDEPGLSKGATVWITGHRGITLMVSSERPAPTEAFQD